MRLVTAIALSGLATLAVALSLHRQLSVSTDVVGYPIYANFNIERVIDQYYLGVLFFPVLALALYLAQNWIASRLGLTARAEPRPGHPAAPSEVEIASADHNVAAVAVARTVAVGASWGFVVTLVANVSAGRFWIVLGAVVLLYGFLAFGVAWVLRRRANAGWTIPTFVAKVNALSVPLMLLGIWAAAATTTITVVSTGEVHHYAWLPWWLAVLLAIGAAALVWPRVLNARTEQALRAIERRALLFVTAPAALFLATSQLYGDLGPMDAFHEGEALVAAHMIAAGALYWRDLLSAHGLLQDVIVPLINTHLLESTRWGEQVGYPAVMTPLTFVSFYFLAAWLFERTWAFVLMLVVLVVSLQFVALDIRFMLWPPILLLLGAALQSRRAWISALVGGGLVVQAILVPESAYCLPPCGLIVILHSLYHRRPGAGLVETLAKPLWMTAGGGAVSAVFGLYLLSQHALGDFFFYYLIFVPGHELVGGIPIHPRAFGLLALFFEVAPLAALLLGSLYFAARVIRKQPLETRDWVIGASGLFALFYYTKFLERADIGHIDQAYGASLPLILFVAYRACTWLDSRLLRSGWMGTLGRITGRQPVAVLLLAVAVVLVVAPNGRINPTEPSMPGWLATAPYRDHPNVANPPVLPLVGYSAAPIDTATVEDMQAIFHAYLQPGDWVFDFSNQPALVYYLLGYYPRTRYYHVSMAITERAQQDLISQLEKDPPKLIVFTAATYGLLNWDGIPNMVRHYEVSQYILDHYSPLLDTHTEIIYARTSDSVSASKAQSLSLQEPVSTSDLPFAGFSCDWGYAPNFLSISPPAPPGRLQPVSLSTAVDPDGLITVWGWAGDTSTGSPASSVVVTVDGQVVGQAVPGLVRPDVAKVMGQPGLAISGYTAGVRYPLEAHPVKLSEVRVFGISAGSVASELPASPGAAGPPVSQLLLQDGTSVPVRPGAVTGSVDLAYIDRQLIISPPAGDSWSGYRWLEVDTSSRFQDDRWAVYDDQTGDPGHQIIFRTLGNSSTKIRVFVGSCAQWHGYGAVPLYLSYSAGEDISAVRLLP